MESYIESNSGHTTFVGPDATKLYQAMTLVSGLRMYAKCGIIPTRGWPVSRMIALASQFTGKRYKRGEASKAAADVQIWIEAMKTALPII